jgi:hypothetical protein
VGAFPDCYERISANFMAQKNEVSALVTCERAVSIFYGWGHPINYHATVMSKLEGRDKEARDAARYGPAPALFIHAGGPLTSVDPSLL